MGSEEDPRDYDFSRKVFKGTFIVAATSGILMWLLMFVWVFGFTGGVTWGTDSKTEINLHVILMTVFMVYLQGHGAIMFRTLPSRPKIQVKLLHAGFHLATVIAVSFGLWSAVRAHNMKGQPHFFTLHSWIGIFAIILFYGQFLAGFLIFLLPYAPMRIRNVVMPYHRFFGPLIFISSCMAAATGMMMKALGALSDTYAKRTAAGATINFAAFFLLIFCLTVTYLVFDPRFKRRPRPEGEMLLADSGSQSQDEGASGDTSEFTIPTNAPSPSINN